MTNQTREIPIEDEVIFLIDNYVLCDDEYLTEYAQKLKYYVKGQLEKLVCSVETREYLDIERNE